MVDTHFSNQNFHNASVGVVPVPQSASAMSDQRWATTPAEERPQRNQKILNVDDSSSIMDKLMMGLAEFGGTAILVFLGCLSCADDVTGGFPVEHIAFSFGLAAMGAIVCFGHISGGHINPVVTVAAATLGQITLIQVPFYLTGQMLGGLVGYGLVKAVTPNNMTTHLCTPKHSDNITSIQALGVEFFLSLILVWVCCGLWDRRNNNKEDSAAIKVGLTITVLILAGANYSGANLNPARSFGPALINAEWTDHWIYWVGPIGAGFVGGIVYRIIFFQPPVNNTELPNRNVEVSSEKTTT